MTRLELEKLYKNYPEVVNLKQFREMLGGVCEITARRLLQENIVQHYLIRYTYYIPKTCVIDYVMSKHYKKYKKLLKHQIVKEKNNGKK